MTFEGRIPRLDGGEHRFSDLFALRHDSDGRWRITGEAGGAADPPTGQRPWVNLAGGHGNDHFYAGGRIDHAGQRIARVQLRLADGQVLEDDAEQYLALFIVDAPVCCPRP